MILTVVLTTVTALLIGFCAFCFYIVNKEFKSFFGGRADRNKNTLQDKKITDFKNLNCNNFNFLSNGNTLNGKIYYEKEITNDVIIFCHGYGAGHQAYITEINYFVKNGFTVIGFDYTGCVNSSGTLTHFYASVLDLNSLWKYLKQNQTVQNKNVYLVGHSWGGYTALCGTQFIPAKKIVALCPFNTPLQVLKHFTIPYEKAFSYILIPFRYIYLKFKFGKKSNTSSFKNINKSQIKSLIIFGGLDTVAPKSKFNFNSNVTTITETDKGHNPYNTVNGEKYLNQVLYDLKTTTNLKQTLNSVDYNLITEQDPLVMEKILKFLTE